MLSPILMEIRIGPQGAWKAFFDRPGYNFISAERVSGMIWVSFICPNGTANRMRASILVNSVKKGTPGCDCCFVSPTSANYIEALERLGIAHLHGKSTRKTDRVRVRCQNSHEWETTVVSLCLSAKNGKAGCPQCRDEKHSSDAGHIFFQELQAAGYEPLDPYVDARTTIRIRRVADGALNKMTRLMWTSGKRWLQPASRPKTPEDLRDEFKLIRPDFEFLGVVEYRGCRSLVRIRCPKGHEYEALSHNLRHTDKCLHCIDFNGQSKQEQDFYEEVLKIFPGKEILRHWDQYPNSFKKMGARKLNFDVYIPHLKLAVEYCGLYYHSDLFKLPFAHLRKLQLAEQNGIRLITIFSDEWLNNREIVLNKIQAAGGLLKKIYARSCSLVQLTKEESRAFFSTYHLQGASPQSITFGLKYEDEIIGAMSLGHLTRNVEKYKNWIELKRLAFKSGIAVTGGSGRLLSICEQWAKEHKILGIISYCDLRYSQGKVYEILGFKNETTRIKPHYHYMRGITRWNAQTFKKTATDRLSGKTERELMRERGFQRIYDCGHLRYVKQF
jgi:hypothetical protein